MVAYSRVEMWRFRIPFAPVYGAAQRRRSPRKNRVLSRRQSLFKVEIGCSHMGQLVRAGKSRIASQRNALAHVLKLFRVYFVMYISCLD